MRLLRQSRTKDCIQINRIKQTKFFYGMFYGRFFPFLTEKRQNLALR